MRTISAENNRTVYVGTEALLVYIPADGETPPKRLARLAERQRATRTVAPVAATVIVGTGSEIEAEAVRLGFVTAG